ncbi:hypothetical protein QBC34DRAFT_424124 [Podospora aff. communis PSN243]|uniref:Uncharacterized protein n=1 Tax=Podospora aff. communis PSN243 TaxID=3040156 RepID=A0AAV9GUD7_9PEZI|nr:hypothetical protein QBC34DRAFT_424124 [Podospora aff. communis PSN243]
MHASSLLCQIVSRKRKWDESNCCSTLDVQPPERKPRVGDSSSDGAVALACDAPKEEEDLFPTATLSSPGAAVDEPVACPETEPDVASGDGAATADQEQDGILGLFEIELISCDPKIVLSTPDSIQAAKLAEAEPALVNGMTNLIFFTDGSEDLYRMQPSCKPRGGSFSVVHKNFKFEDDGHDLDRKIARG